MTGEKRGPGGRPATGRQRTRELHTYVTDEELEQARRLARAWDVTVAHAIRRALREAARQEGIEG